MSPYSSRDVAKTDRRERSKPMRDHRHARSSAEDPTISSTRSGKSVSTNARNHPRAELRDSDAPRQIEAGSGGRQSQGSPAVNHVSSSKSNGGRKRVCEEEDEEGSVWVEHTSSSGRIYYYNKKNGVSQWERPPSMAKRTKTDDIPTKSTSSSSSGGNKHSSQSHSSPSHSHSSHSQHTSSSHSHSRGSGSHRGYSSSSTHHSSHHTSHSSQGHHDRMRERDRGHGSHRRSNRGSRSSSKSASVSPTSSGRGRGPHDKATPNRHPSSRPHHGGRGGSKRGSVSPRVSAAGKQQSSVSTVAVSPCTPSIPHGISQSLVATQQVINQTSAIIKHQQKLLSASGDPATPNTLSPPPSSSSSSKHTSSLSHPHARQKLVFQSNGPLSQEVMSGAGGVAVSTPSTTPLHNSVGPGTAVDMSPQMTGLENLHPLQRALLLQQQQQQHHQQQERMPEGPVRQSTPGTPLPSSGGGGGATPLSQPVQTPPFSALPPHLTSQVSHPGSPYSNSPSHTPSFTTPPPGVHLVSHPMVPGPFTPAGLPPSNSQPPVYQYSVPMVMPPNTPIPGIYMAEGGMVQTAAAAVGVAGGGRAYMTPATPVVPLRPPMSRLGRRRSSGVDEFASYPDHSQVESVASKTVPEIFSRTLAESWWSPAIETLQRQLDTSLREVLSRRTTEALYLHGRLRRSQLSLDSTRLRTNTRRERSVHM
ncbi:hypothetical protein GBAR_LOCUS24050 [Geodia barretti]|uniref:WW domain-containing protein n=2 Tax=Geodia barretti TaxID=519541 RepID=A0AA35T7S2_GEOBA|nr:hypothetical protein GBAR_LOCUS24050 [Geodia barretti]